MNDKPEWQRQIGARVALKDSPQLLGTITQRVYMWGDPCYLVRGDDGTSVTLDDDDLVDAEE